jgi:hypothetical protein
MTMRMYCDFYCYAEAIGKCDKQCDGCKEEINGTQLELKNIYLK